MIPSFFFKHEYLDGEIPVSIQYNERKKLPQIIFIMKFHYTWNNTKILEASKEGK